MKSRDGRTEEQVDIALAEELGTSRGRVGVLKEIANMIGLERIPSLPDQQLDSEFELEMNRAHPGIQGGGMTGLRSHDLVDNERQLQLRGRNVLKRIAELYEEA